MINYPNYPEEAAGMPDDEEVKTDEVIEEEGTDLAEEAV